MNRIYNYHPETGEFMGATTADESPLEPGVFLVPASATIDAPPDCVATERPVFKEGAWVVEAAPQQEEPHQKTQVEIDADNLAAYKQQAQSALDKSDQTMLRCFESAVAVPAEWIAYRKSLRAVVSLETYDPSQSLPDRPTFPVGT
jgi:hypothetical protein